jgi:hypothetical protein
MKCRVLTAPVVLVVILLAGPGCNTGPHMVKISGTVMNKGKPFVVSKKTYVTLTFAAADAKSAQSYPARFNAETGAYDVEIPAGQYRVRCVALNTENNKRLPTKAPDKDFDFTRTQQIDIDVTSE